MQTTTDFLVIGSGIAGLSFALQLAEQADVIVVTKREIDETATAYAQGGIASVFSAEDSFDEHVADTMEAGAWLPHKDIVEMVVSEGPAAIQRLIDWGVEFTRNENQSYDLTREGGHSHRRILHAEDITGREIERALVAAVKNHPRIQVLENHIAVDLITLNKVTQRRHRPNHCLGAYVLNQTSGLVNTLGARMTVLACGGAGKVYLYTCNPDVATGDGVAMGYRAGVPVANMEFMQFHPTTFFHPHAKSFLISEAVRGEGAILKDSQGRAFMADYHRLQDLASRDIVARAIDSEMKKSGADCVYLDIRHKGKDYITSRFPNIYTTLKEYGLDMTQEPIPVVPAAHYLCGGLMVDAWGETAVQNLFAIGETAFTGLHGANRLASNSLLEGAVYAHRAAQACLQRLNQAPPDYPQVPPWDTGNATDSDEEVVVAHNWHEIRLSMWNYVGIVRSNKRLQRALRRIHLIQEEITDYYWDFYLTRDLIELRNIATVAELIVRSALERKESRGLHYTIDYPQTDTKHPPHDTVLQRHI